MGRDEPFIPDWRDPAAYAPLLTADRTLLAWEWLRRDPCYRAVAHAVRDRTDFRPAAAWGLHRFEDPNLTVPAARPIWTREACDTVLLARATAVPPGLDFQFRSGGVRITTCRSVGCEHLLLSDGERVIRLDLASGGYRDRAVQLQFVLPGPPLLAPQLLALRRFDAFVRRSAFSRLLHPAEPRGRRELLLLRTADALACGETQRAIAACLIDVDAAQAGWRDAHPELRLQAQRLVRDARARLAGGYRVLLKTSGPLQGPTARA